MMRYSVQWRDGCGEWNHYAARETKPAAEAEAARLAMSGRVCRVMELSPAGNWEQVYYVEEGGGPIR